MVYAKYMKKQMCLIFWMLGIGAWAAPDLVYHQLPPNCHLVHMGTSWIIQDAKGFFVGYYTPAPPPATYVPQSRPAPSARIPSSSASDYADSSGYNSYGYGSYAQPYVRQGSFSPHCQSTTEVSRPAQTGLTQSGWYSFPTVTQSGF